MAVTGGDDWAVLYDILAPTGWAYSLLLVFFTFFFLFALFNILTGSLVEKAMATSKPDRTDLILRRRQDIVEEKEQFRRLCQAMDDDKDGVISWEEFQKWMCNPVMLTYMATIGIEVFDVELFFNTVAQKEGKVCKKGEITIDHFVEGCMHMKGTATALDMQRQLFEMHVLHHEVRHFKTACEERLQSLEQILGRYVTAAARSEERLLEQRLAFKGDCTRETSRASLIECL